MAPCQNSPYTNKHTEQHKNTQNTKTQLTFRIYFCVFFGFIFIYDVILLYWSVSYLQKFRNTCLTHVIKCLCYLIVNSVKLLNCYCIHYLMIECKNPVKRSDEILTVSENTIDSSWRNYLFKPEHSKIILGCVVKNYIYIILFGWTVKNTAT